MTPSGRREFYVEEPELQFDMGQDYDREREHRRGISIQRRRMKEVLNGININ